MSEKRGTLLPSLGNPDLLRPRSVWASKNEDVPVSHLSVKKWASQSLKIPEKALLYSNRQLHLH